MIQGTFTVKLNDEVVLTTTNHFRVIDKVEELIYEHGPGGINVTRYNGTDYDDITEATLSICE